MSNVGDASARGDVREIRLLIVDDHEVLSSSLAMVLDAEPDISVIGRAPTLSQARRLVTSAHPDVILLDHRLPDGDGVSAIRELRGLHPSAQVVVLTASVGDHVLMEAVEAGAAGFLSKSGGLNDLTSAVRAAAVGESVIAPDMLIRLLRRFQSGEEPSRTPLTEREQEVLSLVSEGLSNAAIAQRMVVSVHTVRNHIASLSAKLGAHSKLEALSIAVRQGLLRDL